MSIEQLASLAEGQFFIGLLVISRLAAAVFAAPPLDMTSVPRRVKALLLLALGAVIVPLVRAPEGGLQVTGLISATVLLAREIMLGMLIGLTVRLLIQGMQLFGEIVATLGGVQTGEDLDITTNAPIPVISRLTGMLCAAIFLGMGGHRWMLDGVLQSFRVMPPGQVAWHAGWLEPLLHDLSASMVAGLQSGAPLIIALLLANLLTGLISRTLPQLNVLIVGFHLNALVMLSVLCVSIGSVGLVYQRHAEAAWERLTEQFLTLPADAGAAAELSAVDAIAEAGDG
jgi:flagellar biosynthetic protein FliR